MCSMLQKQTKNKSLGGTTKTKINKGEMHKKNYKTTTEIEKRKCQLKRKMRKFSTFLETHVKTQ